MWRRLLGNAYAAGTNTCLGFNTSGSYLSLVTVGVAGAWSNDANPGDSVVRVSGGQRLLLNANGGTGSSALACFNNNVGINNYSPAFALDVAGVVRASSQLNTTSNTSMVAPTVGTNGGSGDRFVLWPGSSSTLPVCSGDQQQYFMVQCPIVCLALNMCEMVQWYITSTPPGWAS